MDLELLARPEGFEPPTPWFVAKYSIQLSYGRAVKMSVSAEASNVRKREISSLLIRLLIRVRSNPL